MRAALGSCKVDSFWRLSGASRGRRQSAGALLTDDPADPATPKPPGRKTDPRLLELLVCPVTRAELVYDAERQELISRPAKLAYPIRDGVPIMLPEEARKLDGLALPRRHRLTRPLTRSRANAFARRARIASSNAAEAWASSGARSRRDRSARPDPVDHGVVRIGAGIGEREPAVGRGRATSRA